MTKKNSKRDTDPRLSRRTLLAAGAAVGATARFAAGDGVQSAFNPHQANIGEDFIQPAKFRQNSRIGRPQLSSVEAALSAG